MAGGRRRDLFAHSSLLIWRDMGVGGTSHLLFMESCLFTLEARTPLLEQQLNPVPSFPQMCHPSFMVTASLEQTTGQSPIPLGPPPSSGSFICTATPSSGVLLSSSQSPLLSFQDLIILTHFPGSQSQG